MMRIPALWAAALICFLALGDYAGASPLQRPIQRGPFCTRNNGIVGVSVVAELNRVYVGDNCVPTHACPPLYTMGNLQTISIDGYGNSANWLWEGYDNQVFTIAEQNNILSAGKAKAISSAPPGKSLASIVFFDDLITGGTPTGMVLGEKATFGNCRYDGMKEE
jgi:hypothetical protein